MYINNPSQIYLDDVLFSVVDVETTGMYPRHNRIIDIGVVQIKGSDVVNTWESLIDPEQEIPFWITSLTKISSSQVRGMPYFSKVADAISKMFNTSVFVAHNAGFDYSFIKEEFKRLNLKFEASKICTVQLGRKLVPGLAGYHLDSLSQYFDIKINGRHRALPDALASAQLLMNFIKIAKAKYNAVTLHDLMRLQWITVKNNSFSGSSNMILNYYAEAN